MNVVIDDLTNWKKGDTQIGDIPFGGIFCLVSGEPCMKLQGSNGLCHYAMFNAEGYVFSAHPDLMVARVVSVLSICDPED